jgi:hypothetical protein
MRALPYTYRDVPAAEGQAIVFTVTGEAGGTWSLVREAGGGPAGRASTWRLHTGAAPRPAARVTKSDNIGLATVLHGQERRRFFSRPSTSTAIASWGPR